MLVTSISKENIKKYVIKQLNTFFPDGNDVRECKELDAAFENAFVRIEKCFSHIAVRGYSVKTEEGKKSAYFQHTNSDQYCQFLYFLSNSLWNEFPEKKDICDKLILLNKALHGCWFTYKVKLPDIFILSHPVGSVIGHALYSDYLVIHQNVTIGEREIGATKRIGKYCFLSTGSSIIGDGEIGDNVSIGVNAVIYKEDIESNSIVYLDKNTGERHIKKNKGLSRAHDLFC